MLIFLDTQSTGFEVQDKICSIAIMGIEESTYKTIYELVNDGKKIQSLASSVNHITNEMLKDSPKLKDTNAYKFLQQHNKETSVIVGHNVRFELEMLKKSGFEFMGEIIDTLRLTKHLIPECEQFSLQFLRYELKLYRDEKRAIVPHNAQDNVEVVKNLYDYLLDLGTREDFITLSSKKVLMDKFGFGKYSGRFIEEIIMCDRGYVEWMLNNIKDMDEDLRYSIEFYMDLSSL